MSVSYAAEVQVAALEADPYGVYARLRAEDPWRGSRRSIAIL